MPQNEENIAENKDISSDSNNNIEKGRSVDETNSSESTDNPSVEEGKEAPAEGEYDKGSITEHSSKKVDERVEPQNETQVFDRGNLKSNYQITLINENLLQIKVSTNREVVIDCKVKDNIITKGEEVQTNKIIVHPKTDSREQEIDIVVSIKDGGDQHIVQKVEFPIEQKKTSNEIEKPTTKLNPNPLVASLITRFGQRESTSTISRVLSPEEKLEEKLGRKNPWRLYRELLLRNLKIGTYSAVIISFIVTLILNAAVEKPNSGNDEVERPRLVVIQDVPNINLQTENIQDPTKPDEPEVKEEETQSENKVSIPPITSKKTITPRVKRTNINVTKPDTLQTSKNGTVDTTKKVTVSTNVSTPNDSLQPLIYKFNPDSSTVYSDTVQGLHIIFYKNWKQIKMSDDKLVLVDETSENAPEKLTIYIEREKDVKTPEGYQVFKLDDTTGTTIAYYKEPYKEQGTNLIKYEFIIFGKTQKWSFKALINEKYFNETRKYIEATIRSVRIK
ncbi:MAG: hypothetical protein ACP5P3_03335 [Ignavibacteria bacterium]